MGLREKKKKDLDDKIRSVSREVFLAKGYAKATVEEIAEKAEIGIGSLYNYFPSKADIFIAIMSKELQLDQDDESQLEIDLERDVASSVIQLMEPLLKTTRFLGKKIWRELMAVAFSNSKTNTFLAKGMMKLDYKFIDRIETFLETQKGRGKLSASFDPHQAAYAVYSCAMAQFMIYLYQDEIEFETFALRLRDQIVFLFEGKNALPQAPALKGETPMRSGLHRLREPLFLILAMAIPALAQNATDWVKSADSHARGNTSETEITIQVVRPTWHREMTLTNWSQGRDKALTLVTAPARDKGSAFLKRGHEVWSWMPEVERVIKLPPSMMSQSWMGTDLTNDDFVKESSVVDDYTHAFAGLDTLLGLPCHIVDLTPKPGAPVVWGRIRMSIEDKDRMELEVGFYDEDGILVNTLRATEVGTLGGRRLPTKLEMIPEGKPGQKTVIHYLSAEFDRPIADRIFEVRHLSELH